MNESRGWISPGDKFVLLYVTPTDKNHGYNAGDVIVACESNYNTNKIDTGWCSGVVCKKEGAEPAFFTFSQLVNDMIDTANPPSPPQSATSLKNAMEWIEVEAITRPFKSAVEIPNESLCKEVGNNRRLIDKLAKTLMIAKALVRGDEVTEEQKEYITNMRL